MTSSCSRSKSCSWASITAANRRRRNISGELPVEVDVLCGCCLPRQLAPGRFGARARRGERCRVGEQLAQRLGQRFDVAGGDDAAGPEAAHRLAEPRYVVDDGGDARAESLEERAGLVELGAVRE